MIFSEFVTKLYTELQHDLPGVKSHAEMSPFKRPNVNQLAKIGKTPKQSAVMVLFYPFQNRPHFCLTQRPEYNGTHSGQVSFPGGKMEEVDINLKATALRETFEEVGATVEHIQVLSELTQVYIPPSNFLVTPFIGFCDERPNFVADPIEVVEIMDVSVATLMDESIVKRKSMKMGTSGIRFKVPYYDIQDKVVWGATAVILSEVKKILKPFYTT
ncbi:MAG: CoA pyrophosphatase [Flavobacteriales bacterium]|nr:CoA pyrophosphatase [Flavobacteriales bacterium]